jgi:hypothetical protein
MPKSQLFRVQSQHHPTQRICVVADEAVLKYFYKIPKILLKKDDMSDKRFGILCTHLELTLASSQVDEEPGEEAHSCHTAHNKYYKCLNFSSSFSFIYSRTSIVFYMLWPRVLDFLG